MDVLLVLMNSEIGGCFLVSVFFTINNLTMKGAGGAAFPQSLFVCVNIIMLHFCVCERRCVHTSIRGKVIPFDLI